MFFFSSRRRHTRFDCDWSSDVCSSDLGQAARGSRAKSGLTGGRARNQSERVHRAHAFVQAEVPRPLTRNCAHASRTEAVRSEEHTSELQSQSNLVCRLLLEKKNEHEEIIYNLKNHQRESERV